MAIDSVKGKILEAVQNLPDDPTFEDAIVRLVFLAKIERGLTEAEAGKTVSHAEAKNRLAR